MDLWDAWSTHYREKGIDPGRITRDGIIDERKYADASKKICFVLKETNDFAGGSLTDLLKNGPKFPVFHTTARWAAGMLHDFPPYEEVNTPKALTDALTQVAIINVKKATGTATAWQPQLHTYAHQDRHLLRAQLHAINPDYLVACGTFDILVWLLDLAPAPEQIVQPIPAPEYTAYVLPWRHPSRVTRQKAVYDHLRTMYAALPSPSKKRES